MIESSHQPPAPILMPEEIRRQRLAAYRDAFLTPAGGIVLQDLDAVFGGDPFDAANPHNTSFRCGTLKVMAYILRTLAEAQDMKPRQEQADG
jgi:hypothetical protein